MKRYNSSNRHDVDTSKKLSSVIFGTSKPAYCRNPSKVDKTFFKPGLNEISQLSGQTMKPIYDSLPDGSMPDYGVNIAWVRSKARDRVDIDLALSVVKETIERSKLDDAMKAEEIKKQEDNLSKLADTIVNAKSADSSADLASNE